MKISRRKWITPRYLIKNSITGAYIHDKPAEPMYFYARADAWAYIKRKGLNPEIYFVEVEK